MILKLNQGSQPESAWENIREDRMYIGGCRAFTSTGKEELGDHLKYANSVF